MSIVTHNDMQLHECFIQEIPASWHTSEPVSYVEIAFHVPIMSRDSFYSGKAVDMAVRHYIEKRGQPGRDRVLKIAVRTSWVPGDQQKALRPVEWEFFVRLND